MWKKSEKVSSSKKKRSPKETIFILKPKVPPLFIFELGVKQNFSQKKYEFSLKKITNIFLPKTHEKYAATLITKEYIFIL